VKKALVAILALVMVLGFATTAFAAAGDVAEATFSDIAGHEAEGALTLLGAMGVYSGEFGLGGPVNPDDPITRAQFCKVVVEAFGRGSTALGLMGLQPAFSDEIPTWAWGYVNTAVFMGVIDGYPDGTFKASNPVTYGEAVTMLVRAVSGHTHQVPEGVWPYNFLFYAVDNGFTGAVDVGFANLPATRGDIAQLLVEATQVEQLDGEGVARTGTAKLYPVIGTVTDFDLSTAKITIDDGVAADPVCLVGADDYHGLLNNAVWAAVNSDDEIFFVEVTGEADVITGVFDELADKDDTSGAMDTLVLEDGTEVPFTDGSSVLATINGEELTEADLQAGDEVVIYIGDGAKAINIVATRFEALDWVKAVTPSENYDAEDPTTWTRIETNGGGDYRVPATCKVSVNGATKAPDDLAADDAIVVALKGITAPGDPFEIRAIREVVEGTVEAKSTSYPGQVYKVTIDGTTYILNEAGGISYAGIGIGDLVKFGLDFDGKLYVPVGYETLTPYAVCLAYSEDLSGTTPVYTATFDVRGQEVTYTLDEQLATPSGWIGKYVYLSVDSGSGTVDVSLSQIINIGDGQTETTAQVLAVDKVNGTLTLDTGAGIVFVENPDLVVYEVNDAGDKVYVGIEGLSVDDWVLYEDGQPIYEITDAPS